ncbi:hypothetical protein DF3PB_4230003 [uncultured Defluviicoccus sp.]|uniref:Transposase n=1 Tax=metagenome TaxID=256318 RepID=A0A380TI47_9ZZZZ|nr:hypothetical protein DF3PB_4230003 [uncultured Defluviicoccus sp.]
MSKVERLLDVFRQHPDGIDLTTCSCARRGTLAADSKRGNCQRRFWQHAIRDDADFAAHGLRPLPSGQARRLKPCVGIRLTAIPTDPG